MNIKGIFYVVTKDYMAAAFGEERRQFVLRFESP
jgi:hypothetical protein